MMALSAAVFDQLLRHLDRVQCSSLLDLVTAHENVQSTLGGLADVLSNTAHEHLLLVGRVKRGWVPAGSKESR